MPILDYGERWFYTKPEWEWWNAPRAADDSLEAIEKAHVEAMLRREGWNITRTAHLLSIDRVTLYNKIKKYELKK